jgi:hypothetical protein
MNPIAGVKSHLLENNESGMNVDEISKGTSPAFCEKALRHRLS